MLITTSPALRRLFFWSAGPLGSTSQSLLPRRSSYQLSRMVRQHRSKAAAYFFGRSASCTALKRYGVPAVGVSLVEGAVPRPRGGPDRRPVSAPVKPPVAAEAEAVP